MMRRSIEVTTAKRMPERPIQPLKAMSGRTSPQGRHGPEAQMGPNDQRDDPGEDEQNDDAGEIVAEGDADERQGVEQHVHRHLHGVDQVEALARFEDAAEGGAYEHDRQAQADEADRPNGLGDVALRDVEQAPDDERRGESAESGS